MYLRFYLTKKTKNLLSTLLLLLFFSPMACCGSTIARELVLLSFFFGVGYWSVPSLLRERLPGPLLSIVDVEHTRGMNP